ncbi:MAG: S1C family serine protease [Parcubacteria group bacterium]
MKVDKKYLIILASILVVGFLSGVVGELWVNSFLLPDPYLSFKTYSDLTKKIDDLVSGQNSRKNLTDQDFVASAAVQKAKPATVGIYRVKNFAPNASYGLTQNDLLGQGSIITSDGWILTADTVAKSEKTALFVVTADHRIFKTEKTIIDQPSGSAFLKISAVDLPVFEFSLKRDLADSQSVYLFAGKGSVVNANIANLNFSKTESVNEFIRSSEVYYKYIFVSGASNPEFFGGPIVTSAGRMIGFSQDASGMILPVDCYVSLMKKVVKGEPWKQPYLGVKFYDYSEILNSTISNAKGALILKTRGINADSPAKGILLPDDVILKVESEEIDSNKNLPELLSAYKSGETVKFLIKRAGKEQEVNIKL